MSGPNDATASQLVSDEAIVQGLIAGLLMLGQHAQDRAAAGGSVLVRATLVPTVDRAIEIGHTRMYGFGDSRSSAAWSDSPVPSAEVSATLDDLAAPGVPIMQTARLLSHQIGQVFGIAEMKQISQAGAIQIRYFKGAVKSSIAVWATANSLPTSTEV